MSSAVSHRRETADFLFVQAGEKFVVAANQNGKLSYQERYSLDGDVLTLQYDGGALKFIFASGNLYFDVYEKQE